MEGEPSETTKYPSVERASYRANMLVTTSVPAPVSLEFHQQSSASSLQEGDVMLSLLRTSAARSVVGASVARCAAPSAQTASCSVWQQRQPALATSVPSASLLSAATLLARPISTSAPRFGLEEFLDLDAPAPESGVPLHGRAWSAAELRLKSQEDLHKLWYILLKERNLLATEHQMARSQGARMRAPIRRKLVRNSMARIKVVIGERCRALEEEMDGPIGPRKWTKSRRSDARRAHNLKRTQPEKVGKLPEQEQQQRSDE